MARLVQCGLGWSVCQHFIYIHEAVNHPEQKDGQQGRVSHVHVFLSIFQLCLNISIRPCFFLGTSKLGFFQFDMYGKGLDISTTLKQSYHPLIPSHIQLTHWISQDTKKPFPCFFLYLKNFSADSTLSPRKHSQCHKIIAAHAGITTRKESENDSPNCRLRQKYSSGLKTWCVC